MKSKGQMEMVGALLIAAVMIIVGLVFFQQSNAFIGTATNTEYSRNQTVTFPASGATVELLGQNIIGSGHIVNNSNGALVAASNYTIAQGLGTDGLTATILTGKLGFFSGQTVNVSYTYEPNGYISSSGGRSVALIIPIFFALLIAVIALVPALRNGILDLV